ncbi:DNA uptake protein [Xenococcus sp. PCC 7305]|uniref:ComEA family DNA-binding protein n=1 Tax=Xenococcus sp. PCC 7305 TaxID=102125 RepID=UPI0002AC6EB5|nr:ComEA family DNA-binding protein [Xenococcus sp. PCC 7305]ELS05260.1 DNA uptake protein [Xenococcus sp. PCC 7305]
MVLSSLRKKAISYKILNDPYYRFQSLEEITIAGELGIKINVNQASVDDWLRLPGISIHQGRSLVELVGMGVQLLCIEDVAAALSFPVTRLLPLEPILHFEYYDRLSVLSPQKVNPNRASVAEIGQIPILEIDLASLIIKERENNGSYRNLADLQRRLKLDSQLIANLMHYITF